MNSPALLVSRQLSARELLDACLADQSRQSGPTIYRDPGPRGRYANADAIDASRWGLPTSPPLAELPIAIGISSRSKACAPRWVRRFSKDWVLDDSSAGHRALPARTGLEHSRQTNTPEFGPCSQTFNRVLRHQNPWDTTKTCGGSSGGAAGGGRQLACCRLPMAPAWAAACAIQRTFAVPVGLRTSPGSRADLSFAQSLGNARRARPDRADPRRMPPGCCRCRRATTSRWRSALWRPRYFRQPLDRDFQGVASAGARRWADCRSERAFAIPCKITLKRFRGHRRRDRGGCARSVHRR